MTVHYSVGTATSSGDGGEAGVLLQRAESRSHTEGQLLADRPGAQRTQRDDAAAEDALEGRLASHLAQVGIQRTRRASVLSSSFILRWSVACVSSLHEYQPSSRQMRGQYSVGLVFFQVWLGLPNGRFQSGASVRITAAIASTVVILLR